MTPVTYEAGRKMAQTVSEADAPLRIAIVHTSDRGGGAEIDAYQLHCRLRELGHDSQMYVAAKRGTDSTVHEIPRQRPFPGVLRAARFVEDRWGWQYLYQPWFRKLPELIGDVDIVHYHSLWYGRNGYAEVAALPRLTKRYPSLMTLHDWWMFTGHCARPAINCERWKAGCGKCPDLGIVPAIQVDGTRYNLRQKTAAIRRSQLRVTAVSDWLAQEVQGSPVFEGRPVATVYNGVDEQVFQPRDRLAMRHKLGLPLDGFVVLLAGQSVEGIEQTDKEAAEYAVEAAAFSGVSLHLVAVGRSSEKVLRLWGREGTAVPFITDSSLLADYYSAADVVVVASLWETFGRVAAEAQMCGVPVAAFATGGLPEVVQHEQTGLIAERLNAQALGAAIRTLYDNPEQRRRYAAAAAERSPTQFGSMAVARQYVEQYRAEIAWRTTTASDGERN